MDFSFTPEQEDFRKHMRDWVDNKLPKNVAREWEAKEFEYPTELWDLMSEQGLHAVGSAGRVRRGRRRCRHTDDHRTRALAQPWGTDLDLGHFFILRKIGGALRPRGRQTGSGSEAGGRRHPDGNRRHRTAGGTDVSVPCRPRRRRSTAAGGLPGRRSGRRRPTSPTTCCCSPAPTVRRKPQGITIFLVSRTRPRVWNSADT